jgi:predicted HAD superfamily Cof-like phosphohydrolase
MKTNYEKVIEFNTCFNHKVSDKEYLEVFETEPKLVDLRLKLIKEEIDELTEAFNQNDLVEIIDALTDILYVVYGLCACFGININKYYKNYILSLMNKNHILSDNETYMIDSITNYERTKYLNKTNSSIILLNNYSKNITNREFKTDLRDILNDINKIYDYLELSCSDQDYEQVVENVLHLLYNTYTFGIKIGLNLDESYTIVHDSNMTKLCETEDIAKETVLWYKQHEARYDTPIYRKTLNGYIILNESSGKILKSIKYTPANFSSLLINI